MLSPALQRYFGIRLLGNALQHLFGMRAVPVDTIAYTTHGEAILREVHIQRDPFEYRLFVDTLERNVTFQAA